MGEIELLINLQDVDSKIDKSLKDEKSFHSRLKEIEEELKNLEEEFSNKKQELKNTKKEKLERELHLKELEGKIKRHEDEKYKVKSKDEFEALEREIAILEKEKDKEEDCILELMEKEEVLSGVLPSLEKELKKKKESLVKEKEQIKDKLEEVKKERENLITERENISSKIKSIYYEQYERLRKMRDGLAVAVVKDGVCSGCNVKVSPSLIGQMKRGEVVYCEGCSRIIYLGKRSGS